MSQVNIDDLIKNDHILEIDNFIPDEICDDIVETLSSILTIETRAIRINGDIVSSDDFRMGSKTPELIELDKKYNICSHIIDLYEKKYEMNYYPLLENHREKEILGMNYQESSQFQGYHSWHCDRGDRRYVTFIIYLNDIELGGETHFLYQKKLIKPSKGKIVIFPTGYTHTHRGNPVLTNETKSILTGWIGLGFEDNE